jgi:hypothetical protein
VYYIGTHSPAGWIKCDGRVLSESDPLYYNLRALLSVNTLPNLPQLIDISSNAITGGYIIKY